MIIFLYGPDTYRSRQKLNEIIERYKKIHKSGLNLKFFDGEIVDFEEFHNEICSISMFAEKKLIILKELLHNKNFKENFLKSSKKFIESKDIILFYEDGEIPKGDEFFEFLTKCEKSQDFKLLEGERLKNWVQKELEKYQAKIEVNALEKLIDFVGNNLWRMANEIKKIVSYKSKCRNVAISSKDIELLVRPKIETDIFKTIEAIALKNKKQALNFLKAHLEKGDSPLYLLHMINFQFRNLLLINDLIEKHKTYDTILRESNLHPYTVKKSYELAKKFTLQELKKIYQKIFQVDLSIKTGKVDPETALDLLIAEI